MSSEDGYIKPRQTIKENYGPALKDMRLFLKSTLNH